MWLELDATHWNVITDTVMGGVSRGQVLPLDGGVLFRGQLSHENNGGFASMRCRFPHDFADMTAFRLTVRGDGRRYQFRLRANESPVSVAWRAMFGTDGTVQWINLTLSDFEPVVRGRPVTGNVVLSPAEIHWLGIMIADNPPGPFALEVHAIEIFGNG